MARETGLKETDLAHIVRAKRALRALHALSIRLCYSRPTESDIMELRECIAHIGTALEITTLWLGPQIPADIRSWLETVTE